MEKNQQDEVGQNQAKQNQAQPQLEEKKKGSSFSHIMGQILWLLGRSPIHRFIMIEELEWLIYPAVMNKQFMMFFNEKKQVVGVALWALVNKEVDERLNQKMVKLRPGEWRNGENLWLIELIAPFGKVEEMLKQLKRTAFRGRSFKTFGVDEKTRQMVVKEMQGDSIIKDVKVSPAPPISTGVLPPKGRGKGNDKDKGKQGGKGKPSKKK